MKKILGSVIKDIQHVGSTSVPSIKAKPIIDIAVAVNSFDDVLAFEKELKDNGFYYRPDVRPGDQLLFACGSYYEGFGDLQTHFIHVVPADSMEWVNYINFRDYLNKTPSAAKEYEDLKVSLAKQAPADSGREKYTAKIIAIVHRHNDVEDKLVAVPEGVRFTREEIAEAVRFQERYYDSEIENII